MVVYLERGEVITYPISTSSPPEGLDTLEGTPDATYTGVN